MSDDLNPNMTPAQAEAFNRCEQIMREHFDAAILVVSCAHDTDMKADVLEGTFNGGYAAAFGLLEIGKEMVRRVRDKRDEKE